MSIFKSNSKIIAAFTALFMIASLTFSVNSESDVNTSENQTSVSSSNEEITKAPHLKIQKMKLITCQKARQTMI